MNLANDDYSGMRARETPCPVAWPKHYRPWSHRLLGLKVRVHQTPAGVIVDVPMSRVLLAALVPAAAISAWSGSGAVPTRLPEEWLEVTLLIARVAGLLALPALVLVMGVMRAKQSVIRARPAPEPVVTVIRRGLLSSGSADYRRGQVDSLRIAERRDHKLRRHYTLELFADDGFDHVLLRSFPPGELERAAREIRNTIEPRNEGVERPAKPPVRNATDLSIAAAAVMAQAA